MLRKWAPSGVRQALGFITRLGTYWRIDRSNSLRVREGVAQPALYVNRSLSVIPPESITAFLNWQYHGVEMNESSTEAAEFLELCKGRRHLFDIGAQTGFMSALFARFQPNCRILSVEPDPQVLPILRRAGSAELRAQHILDDRALRHFRHERMDHAHG